MGAMSSARHAKSVFAHLYVSVAYICWLKSGNAMPKRLRERLWPASADDAKGP